MAKILTRQQLLDEIEKEYENLVEIIGQVSDEELISSRVNSAGWSLKDVLAHIADWAIRCALWCSASKDVSVLEVPAPGYRWSETRELNREIYLSQRDLPVKAVLTFFKAGHVALVEIAHQMNEIDLLTPKRFAWTGPTWAVSQHIRANTASHYRWATKHFRKWLRTRLKQSAKPPTRLDPHPEKPAHSKVRVAKVRRKSR